MKRNQVDSLIRIFVYLWLLTGICCFKAHGQVAVTPFVTSQPQFFDGNGKPLATGCIFTYAAGTTTNQATYTDSTGTVQNANPIILNSGGFPPSAIWLSSLSYKFKVMSFGGTACASGSTIRTEDNVKAPVSANLANTFTGTTTFSGPIVSSGTNTFSGTNNHTGTETFANINNCYSVDGVLYATIQAAINAAPVGGCVHVPAGAFAPTSTVSITKALIFTGDASGVTTITPTSAVTGAGISVNPAVAAQVILRNFTLNMVNVPTIPAITVNNLAANSELGWLQINQGTIGLDITNSGVDKFHDLYLTNQTSFGIRDNADGGAEHHYDSVWLINNSIALAPTTTALFSYTRTTSTDVGGLYFNNVRAIQNLAGGTVTNGLSFVSTAGSRSDIFGNFTDVIVDGITGGDSVVANNVFRIGWKGGQITNAKANQSCSAATVSCFAAVSLVGAAQMTFSSSTILSSNNRDISFSGNVDRTSVIGTHLFGSAAAGAAHLWVVTGATLANSSIGMPDWDPTGVFSNNEAALIASTNSNQTYSNGRQGLADGGACSTPGLYFTAQPTTGFARTASGQISLCSTGSTVASINGSNFTVSVPIQDGSSLLYTKTIASGTAAMTTALIGAGACGTTVTVAATGVATTDVINEDFNGAVTAANNGLLIFHKWPTSGNVNFNYCNPGAAGITPTAMTVNWSVQR